METQSKRNEDPMKKQSILPRGMSRRDLLRAGLYGLGVAGLSAAPLPPMFE